MKNIKKKSEVFEKVTFQKLLMLFSSIALTKQARKKHIPIHFFKVFSFHMYHKWNLCLMEHESIFSEIFLKCKAVWLCKFPELPKSNAGKKKKIHIHAQDKIRLKPNSDRLIIKVHTNL